MKGIMDLIRNSRKPILGLISGLIVSLALRVGLDVDPLLADSIAAAVFATVVRIARPIFGYPGVETPQVDADGRKIKG